MLSTCFPKTKLTPLSTLRTKTSGLSCVNKRLRLGDTCFSNSLSLRCSQPGLPTWWRLAAPSLNWVGTFVKQVSWSLVVLNSESPIFGNCLKIKTDWAAPRAKMVTLTRGPMARKKESRVQFLLPRKPIDFIFFSKVQDPLSVSHHNLRAKLSRVRIEEELWAGVCFTPLTLAKSTTSAWVCAPGMLLWR